MSNNDSYHDDMLFEMLRQCKTLPNFLDEIFGFLQRRTDFYHVAKEPNAAVGLPEGLAENLLRHTFHKWKPQYPEILYADNDIPAAIEETVVCSSDDINEVTSATEELSIDNISEFTSSEYYNGDAQKLLIHLDKCQEMWWNCLIKSEPELDISKIDCTRPYEDLPEEAQAKIEELQWNQERKRLGLPTSGEIALHDKLKKSWNAEGSPFSGPFDPSTVEIS
ncbi:hypothetical protein JTB14_020963 [Gonioctena quinquepunctata]|nr:hypothetical protein JTB14_020963 [Gonioctena quinquepunctata]